MWVRTPILGGARYVKVDATPLLYSGERILAWRTRYGPIQGPASCAADGRRFMRTWVGFAELPPLGT